MENLSQITNRFVQCGLVILRNSVPSENIQFDSDFLTHVTANVQEIFTSCTDDPSEVLSGPLQYEEVARVCLQLKSGVCGVLIDYEHVKFAGPDL